MVSHSAQAQGQHGIHLMPRAGMGGRRPRLVIVGSGFAGLTVAKRLLKAPADITLIDRENHHLFQPLLYQVAAAGLSPADIGWPIKRLVQNQINTRVLLGEIAGIDRALKCVKVGDCKIAYDVLVLATGATHGYFGHNGWATHAPGLKTIDDATEIRRRLLVAFERAEMESDAYERERLLTIVVVGGGPTGVEMGGTIDPRQTRVLLLEAGPRLLPSFPESLSRYAEKTLPRLGVDVRLERAVTHCGATGVMLGDENVSAGTMIWAAGVDPSPAADWLAVARDCAGRVQVGHDLGPPGLVNVFIIGDTALAYNVDDKPLPGIAPVAKQQRANVAGLIKANLSGRPELPAFRYSDRGQLATIGRKTAVIAFGRLQIKGRLALWIWGMAHFYFLISLRNRLTVVTQWLWSFVTSERGARLITGRRTHLEPEGLGH